MASLFKPRSSKNESPGQESCVCGQLILPDYLGFPHPCSFAPSQHPLPALCPRWVSSSPSPYMNWVLPFPNIYLFEILFRFPILQFPKLQALLPDPPFDSTTPTMSLTFTSDPISLISVSLTPPSLWSYYLFSHLLDPFPLWLWLLRLSNAFFKGMPSSKASCGDSKSTEKDGMEKTWTDCSYCENNLGFRWQRTIYESTEWWPKELG